MIPNLEPSQDFELPENESAAWKFSNYPSYSNIYAFIIHENLKIK